MQRSARDFLHSYLFLQVGLVGGACTDVKQTFHQASKFEKREQLLRVLQDPTRNPRERTLIFADFLATYLSEEAFPTTSIHGDRL